MNLKSLSSILLFSMVLFTSCKDDDVVVDQANLVGDKWTYDNADAGNDFANAFIDALYEGTEYQFKADKTYSGTILGLDYDGTWAYANEKITLDAGDENEEVWDIIELSSSTLQFSSTTIDDESEEETTITYTYKR